MKDIMISCPFSRDQSKPSRDGGKKGPRGFRPQILGERKTHATFLSIYAGSSSERRLTVGNAFWSTRRGLKRERVPHFRRLRTIKNQKTKNKLRRERR